MEFTSKVTVSPCCCPGSDLYCKTISTNLNAVTYVSIKTMLRLSDRSVGEEIRNLYMNLSRGYRRVTEDKLLIFSLEFEFFLLKMNDCIKFYQ